jgi:hypothetical protein
MDTVTDMRQVVANTFRARCAGAWIQLAHAWQQVPFASWRTPWLSECQALVLYVVRHGPSTACAGPTVQSDEHAHR